MPNHYEKINQEKEIDRAIARVYASNSQLLEDVEDMRRNGRRKMSESDIERAAIIRDMREICRG
jgi:hypothetical protein